MNIYLLKILFATSLFIYLFSNFTALDVESRNHLCGRQGKMLRAATSHSPAIAIPAALLAFSAARISPSLSFRRLSTFGLALAGRAFLHCTLSRRFPLPGMVNLSLMSDRLPVSKGIRGAYFLRHFCVILSVHFCCSDDLLTPF